jgi:hypothetical protein
MLEAAKRQLANTKNEGHAGTILRNIHLPDVLYVMAVHALSTF